MRVERDAEFEPALRAALVADRPTVIQLALDRAWLSIDEPPGLMRPTFHLVPADGLGALRTRPRPLRGRLPRDEGFIHCTDGVDALGATFDRHYAAIPGRSWR